MLLLVHMHRDAIMDGSGNVIMQLGGSTLNTMMDFLLNINYGGKQPVATRPSITVIIIAYFMWLSGIVGSSGDGDE